MKSAEAGIFDLLFLESELLNCKRYYRSLLQKINGELESASRWKRFSPVSASLPNRESTFFLDRLNTIRLAREEELNHTQNDAGHLETHQKRRKPFVPKVKILITNKCEETHRKYI